MEEQYGWFCASLERAVLDNGDSYIVPSSEGDLVCTASSCTCSFRSSMQLPCRHIFLIRHRSNLELFEEGLCCERWKQSYFKANVRLLNVDKTKNDDENDDDDNNDDNNNGDNNDGNANDNSDHNKINEDRDNQNIDVDTVPRVIGNTVQKRFRQAKVLTDAIADIVSNFTGAEFEARMKYLRSITGTIQNGVTLEVTAETTTGAMTEVRAEATGEVTTESMTEGRPEIGEVTAEIGEVTAEVTTEVTTEAIGDIRTEITTEVTTEENVIPATNLKLASARTARGRPKGAGLTAIGLSKKKAKDVGPQPFCKRYVTEKKTIILSWFVGEHVAGEVVKGYKKITTEDLIDFDPQKLLLCSQDDAVDLKIIRPFTYPDVFQTIFRAVMNHSETEPTCPICHHEFDNDEVSQKCASCLHIHHLECIDRVVKVKRRYWFCKSCTQVSRYVNHWAEIWPIMPYLV